MNWYTRSFTTDYLTIYAHRDQEEAETHIDNLLRLIKIQSEWKILDLACGDGRYSFALQKRGFPHVTGLDLSLCLLQCARKQTRLTTSFVNFVSADMRKLPFRSCSFNLILSMFTSFGYFVSDNENESVIHQIADSLSPGGFFYLDYLNADYVMNNLIPFTQRQIDDVYIEEKRWINQQSSRVEKEIKIDVANNVQTYYESIRLFTKKELDEMLMKAGLSTQSVFGNYNHNDFKKESPRLIYLAKKR